MALPKQQRLAGNKEFTALFRGVRPHHTEHLSIRARQTDARDSAKIAVVVPARVAARAVDRNRLRRRVSEALRRSGVAPRVCPGVRAVISVSAKILPSPRILEEELVSLLRKSAILLQ